MILPQRKGCALQTFDRSDFLQRAMNATPDEFWSHPTTRAEIEHLQETLRNIANELGQERAAVQMPRLNLILDDVRTRCVKLELDVAEPPTHFALSKGR